MTRIPVDEIDTIKDEDLRDALREQKEDREQDAPHLTLPVAYMPSRVFSHGWSISRRPSLVEMARRQKEAQDHSAQGE